MDTVPIIVLSEIAQTRVTLPLPIIMLLISVAFVEIVIRVLLKTHITKVLSAVMLILVVFVGIVAMIKLQTAIVRALLHRMPMVREMVMSVVCWDMVIV